MKKLTTFNQFIKESIRDEMKPKSEEEIKNLLGPERYTLFSKYEDILTDKSPEYIRGYIDDIVRKEYMKMVLTTDRVTCNNEEEFRSALSDIPKSGDIILKYSSHLTWYEDSKPVNILTGNLNDGNEWKYFTKKGIANFFYDYTGRVSASSYKLHTISYTSTYLRGDKDAFRVDIDSNDPNRYSDYGWHMTIDTDDNKKFREYIENILHIPYVS